MRNILTLLFIFFLLPLVAQQTVDDFRGLEWGTKLDDVTLKGEPAELEFYARINGEDYYFLPQEDLMIGTAMTNRILYVFDEFDRFTKLSIDGMEASNEEMNAIVRSRFGKPDAYQVENRKATRSWYFEDVTVTMHEWKSGDYVLEFKSEATRERKDEINSEITDF